MREDQLKALLRRVGQKKISQKKALEVLRELPYIDLEFAKLDQHRALRRGFPEVVFAEGKSPYQVAKIAKTISSRGGILFITHANEECFNHLKKDIPGLKYSRVARIIYNTKLKKRKIKGNILIVTAGTSDFPVAEEARMTLEVMGYDAKMLYDVGVAGIHRLLDKVKIINRASCVIVIAGMEGALASVVSGLCSKPVIAVPTSVGYGASFKGLAALLTMLNACSPGIGVVNIDNGFGAAYLASLIVGR